MYAVIVGGGRVGYHLAKALVNAGHEVFVIEQDARKCEAIAEELGNIVLKGDGSEPSVLKEAGVNRADVFIAVTGSDEDNLAACQLARHVFNAKRTIALVNNPQNEPLFRHLGVDVPLSSTQVLLTEIEEEIPPTGQFQVLHLRGQWSLVVVEVPPGGGAIGRTLQELEVPPGTLVMGLIGRDGEMKSPSPDTRVEARDLALALTPSEGVEALLELFAAEA